MLRLVGRILRGCPGALIARVDASTEPNAALAKVRALTELQPDTAFLVDWPGAAAADVAQEWQRFLAQAQLSFAAVQPQGDIAAARLDQSQASRLFVARTDSRAWHLAAKIR